MKRNKLFVLVWMSLLSFICIQISLASNSSIRLKVLQFNIWQEGTQVPGGFDAIVDEIERSNADVITLSEVRNYKNKNFTLTLVDELKKKGLTYYQQKSEDSNLISKYPIISHGYVFKLKDDHGSITKAVVDVGSVHVAVYSAHLDYTHYACYLPRGYSGITWKELANPVANIDDVLQMNIDSKRDEQIRAFINDALEERKLGKIILLGGDFNEPSFKDWIVETKNLFDHNGLVVPWHCTLMLDKHGFVDAYRTLNPNPITHPGFTWPSDNSLMKTSQLTWTPKADERDRIDYVFHYPDIRLNLASAIILGPKSSIVNNERMIENTSDEFMEPLGVWPTDHKALLVTYTLTMSD